MRNHPIVLAWMLLAFLAGIPASAQNPAQVASKPPLVLVGGTIVDVTDWGRSALDQQNSIVIIQNGKITDVGSRFVISVPKGAWVIDCTGKYLIPGLVDGFAGMNSQGQANADLYMGVTTVVASGDDRRGRIDFAANPSPTSTCSTRSGPPTTGACYWPRPSGPKSSMRARIPSN